jgi:hypothetical protein
MYDGCYQRITGERSWIDAAIFAAQQNAIMAAVHSMSHYRWLLAHLSRLGWDHGVVWLGGNDIATPGTWQNLDGSAFDFAYWAQGHPTASSSDGRCAYFSKMFGWVWLSAGCGDAKEALIKWSPGTALDSEGNLDLLRALYCMV